MAQFQAKHESQAKVRDKTLYPSSSYQNLLFPKNPSEILDLLDLQASWFIIKGYDHPPCTFFPLELNFILRACAQSRAHLILLPIELWYYYCYTNRGNLGGTEVKLIGPSIYPKLTISIKFHLCGRAMWCHINGMNPEPTKEDNSKTYKYWHIIHDQAMALISQSIHPFIC